MCAAICSVVCSVCVWYVCIACRVYDVWGVCLLCHECRMPTLGSQEPVPVPALPRPLVSLPLAQLRFPQVAIMTVVPMGPGCQSWLDHRGSLKRALMVLGPVLLEVIKIRPALFWAWICSFRQI